jgi:hypothetical protein
VATACEHGPRPDLLAQDARSQRNDVRASRSTSAVPRRARRGDSCPQDGGKTYRSKANGLRAVPFQRRARARDREVSAAGGEPLAAGARARASYNNTTMKALFPLHGLGHSICSALLLLLPSLIVKRSLCLPSRPSSKSKAGLLLLRCCAALP